MLDGALTVGVVAAVALFGQAFVRLRRRGRTDLAGWDRAVLFGLAVAIALVALVSPLDRIAEEDLLSAHMLQHVLIGDLAPALALVALRGPLVFFLLPPAPLRALAGLGPLRRALRVLLKPGVAFGVWGASLAAWHVPAAYDYALAHPAAHAVEHACFLIGGVLVWAQLVDPARRRALGAWGGLGYALALFAAGQVLANYLIFSYRPVYAAYAARPSNLLGLSPIADQGNAALVMTVEQLLTLGTFVALRLRGIVRAPLVLPREGHPLVL